MSMLYFCLLLGYVLGVRVSSYPLPHRLVHVFFMHRQPPEIFPSFAPSSNFSEPNFGNSLSSGDYSEPNFGNSLYSGDHNLGNPVYPPFPPMRKLFHDMMNYLDKSMGSIEDMDRAYNEPMARKVEDPWVHFITRTKTALGEPDGKANTTVIETLKAIHSTLPNMTHITEKDWNTTVVGNHTDGIDEKLSETLTSTTMIKKPNMTHNHTLQKDDLHDDMNNDRLDIARKTNVSYVSKRSADPDYIEMNDTIAAEIPFIPTLYNISIRFPKRIRRHSNESKLEHVTTTARAEEPNGTLNSMFTTTKPLNELLGNQNETVWNDMTQKRDTLEADNQTKEIVSFTSTVEKMIDLIDKQLENKTQALLKRMKRVIEIKDDLLKDNIGSYVKYNVAKNNTESNLTKVDSKPANDNSTPNKTLDTTEPEKKIIDTTAGALETMATLGNETPTVSFANATVTTPPASNDNNQTNSTSLPAPLEAHTAVQTDSKPDLAKGLSVENATKLNEEAMKVVDLSKGKHVENATKLNEDPMNVVDLSKGLSVENVTKLNEEPKDVVDLSRGISVENGKKLNEKPMKAVNLSKGLSVENATKLNENSKKNVVENATNEDPMKHDATERVTVLASDASNTISSHEQRIGEPNSPSRTLTKTTETQDEDYENGQRLRNVLDLSPDENVMDKSRKNEDDQLSSGDLMTALVIPVFLVALMGGILYAMHNMSQYVINYMGESNEDRTNQDNHEMTTLIATTPEPSDNRTPPANQIDTTRSPTNQVRNGELTPLIVNNPRPNANTGEVSQQRTPPPDNIETNKTNP